jgi:small subunit ribosomal protein S6
MFLISQAEAADLAGVVEHIESLFARNGAERLAMRKWDERRLAYEIDKQKRGVYLLTYLRMATDRLTGFERDCNLSERILRFLIVKADHFTAEEIASADARAELAIEAKLRAERAAEREASTSTGGVVSLGAPTRDDQGDAADDSERFAEAAADEE